MNIKFLYLIVFLWFVGNMQAQEIITPAEAVELALENNYGIKLAYNNLEVAENNADILNSGYLPTLAGNAGAVYNKDNIKAEFREGDPLELDWVESSGYNASVDVNYVIFDGLGRSYNYKQFKEARELSELEVRATIENTILQLFTVYYNVAELAENTNSLEQTLNISKDRLLRSNYQFEYGQNTKLAVLNAEVDINNDSINLMVAEQQLKNYKRDLNLVLGNALANNFDIDTSIAFENLYNKEELYEKAKLNNIGLLRADKNIEINRLRINVEKSAYLPTIGLTGTYGWNKNNNNPASFLTARTNTGVSGGLNLRWNLFDGGTTITRVKNAKLNLEAQNILKEELAVTIERDFNNAWDNYQNRLDIFRLEEENIVTSQNNFDRTQEKFKLGQVNSIEFRQAQQNLLSAELNRNRAKYLAKIAELEMLQICGELLNVAF